MEKVVFTKELSTVVKDGKQQVLVRAEIAGSFRMRFKTGIMVPVGFFSKGQVQTTKKGRFSPDVQQCAIDAKNALESYCSKLDEIINLGISSNKELTREWVDSVMDLDKQGNLKRESGRITKDSLEKSFFPNISTSVLLGNTQPASKEGIEDPNQPVYKFFTHYCTSHRIAYSRAVNYKVLARIIFRFEQFEQIVSKRKDFVFAPNLISEEDLLSLREYMKHEGDLYASHKDAFDIFLPKLELVMPRETNHKPTYGIANKSDNYILCMMKKLRSLQQWLCSVLKITTNNPYIGIDLGVEQRVSRPVYLSKDERNLVASFDFSDNPKLAMHRDIFIFQCMTACRYEDLRALTTDNVNGNILEYIPMKLRRQVSPPQPRVPLTDDCMKILDRYRPFCIGNKLLPCASTTTYNEALKKIFETCGLKRKVFVLDALKGVEVQKPLYEVAASHMARRTFIGNAYKMTKDPNIIASMSGHVEGSQAFNRYRDIDDEIRSEVISLIQ